MRDHFQGTWARGFAVAEVTAEGTYRVRRVSDEAVLPGSFAPESIRPEKRRRKNWWY